MELIYDGQCRFNGETSEQQDYKSEVDLHHSSIKRQNESHIQMRSKYTARESPFLLHQFIAVAMAVRFFLMLVMLVFIFIHSSNPKAPSSTNAKVGMRAKFPADITIPVFLRYIARRTRISFHW
ncbi:NKG2-D type II integral membrane protein isoform X2 [Macrotis lagotis]|uniref:NKG2-D type II integral membrane protein isoform X2 n=1 Tax=Macrotis lagotis TaxID=92651 RepID=UPI003D68645D